MPNSQEWELPTEAPAFIFEGDTAATLFPEVTNNATVTMSTTSIDLSSLPATFQMTIDGEPFLVRGNVQHFDATTGLNGLLETRPSQWGGGDYSPLLNGYFGEYDTIEEFDMAERNTRKLLAIADLADVAEDEDSDGQLEEFRRLVRDAGNQRQEVLADLAENEKREKECQGYLDRATGTIVHNYPCPMHPD